MLKKISFLLNYWKNIVLIRLMLIPYVQKSIPLTTLGNHGAAWKVPLSLINKNSICYSAGVGEDISFEIALYKLTKAAIYLFDPTPRSIIFIDKQRLPSKIRFSPWGLWAKNSKQKFFAPPEESYVSHSIVNLHKTQDFFVAECKSLKWIMKRYGHTELDLLKIDIEGSEYMVLNELLGSKLRPKVLAIEFDQPTPVNKTFTMIKKLIDAGYILVDQTDWNFIFIYS